MDDDQTAALVREHVRAFSEGDLDALLAGLAEDTVWITGRTTVRGKADLEPFFKAAIDDLRPRLAIENLVVRGSKAAAQMTETLVWDGAEQAFPIAAFFSLREGLIVTAKVYREGTAELG
ncbi:MAG: nuclear transport factor 2 family protein [Catenulispora sp.]|nr:nuclear transport factor 2 family protein [Catenulispora sp.]